MAVQSIKTTGFDAQVQVARKLGEMSAQPRAGSGSFMLDCYMPDYELTPQEQQVWVALFKDMESKGLISIKESFLPLFVVVEFMTREQLILRGKQILGCALYSSLVDERAQAYLGVVVRVVEYDHQICYELDEDKGRGRFWSVKELCKGNYWYDIVNDDWKPTITEDTEVEIID